MGVATPAKAFLNSPCQFNVALVIMIAMLPFRDDFILAV
jgi:hypothetical protein